MSSLQYRIVTNWPASMKEDFVFAPTEDRNAHYDLVVEILSCIADEKDPRRFRLTEETMFEYEVMAPKEPCVPCMPLPSGARDGDAEFLELCQRYMRAEDGLLFGDAASARNVRMTCSEEYTLEGDELAEIAALAKRSRSDAKLRFILGKYGVSRMDDLPQEAFRAKQAGKKKSGKKKGESKKPKKAKSEKKKRKR